MTDAGQKEVSNLQVAFGDGKIDAAFWGHNLATKMGLSKTGEVYRFDWITLVSLGQNLFKLVSNGGTEVKELKDEEAANVRGEVKDTLVCMSPTFGMTRSDKMNLPTSRVSLSVVAHMKKADISQDHSTAYKSSVIVPHCYIKEFRSLSNSENGLAYYKGCPHCKKAIRNDETCPDHGRVVPNQVVGIQDPCTTGRIFCNNF